MTTDPDHQTVRDARIDELEAILNRLETGLLHADNLDAYLCDHLGQLYPPDYRAYCWRWENRRQQTAAGALPAHLRHRTWHAARQELAAALAA